MTVLFTRKSNLRVQGTLVVDGTAGAPVSMSGRSGARWGGISFENTTTPSSLRHVVLRGATKGYDATVYPSAISGLNATLVLDFVDIRECEGPVFCRGGSTTLRDSILQNPYTGDGINVKQGQAVTQRCVFYGNNQPDTDAIDYDGVVNGLIEDCRLYRYQGFNSDGIDIGEACSNILIQRNQIYYNSDKGVSVGQGSTVTLRHNLVVGCALGVGIKDSGSTVLIDQNTFYECDVGVAVYEKNFGDGGGAATVTHSIISRSSLSPVSVDALSTCTVDWSLCDTLPMTGTNNQFADPLFVDPVLLNFQLQPASPAIDTGDPAHAPDPDLTPADRGAALTHQASDYPFTIGETVVINEILANSETGADWIELYNRTQSSVDIGGWFLSDDGADLLKYRIPPGTVLPPAASPPSTRSPSAPPASTPTR
ncbi:MAG: right-handed parallel beta-helix repeat-containing protein [Kiritimatiellia bacterium]